jgi:hypothetical protein
LHVVSTTTNPLDDHVHQSKDYLSASVAAFQQRFSAYVVLLKGGQRGFLVGSLQYDRIRWYWRVLLLFSPQFDGHFARIGRNLQVVTISIKQIPRTEKQDPLSIHLTLQQLRRLIKEASMYGGCVGYIMVL